MSALDTYSAKRSQYSAGESTLPSPLACAILVAMLPFTLQYTYILNSFYYFGAPYFDAGLFANLLWHNDWLLATPHVYGGDHSYLQVHFSPFLVAVNALSYVFPLHMVEFFATFMGLIYASLAAAMNYTMMLCLKPKKVFHVIAIGLLATGFAFNGVIMQGVWMPHFEYAIPAGILLFLVHLKRSNMPWAIFFFCLTLSMREDAGLHISSILGLLIALTWFLTRDASRLRLDITFMLIACFYSATAFAIQKYLGIRYQVQASVFELIYSGDPAYHHLSFSLLASRIGQILEDSPYIYAGFLVSLISSIIWRNAYWGIGFAAGAPWFLLNWTAANNNTGVLYAYYAFPFVVSFGWPFVSILCQFGEKPPSAAVRQAVIMQSLLVLVGLIAWNREDHQLAFGPSWWARWGSYVSQWSAAPYGKEIDIRPDVRDIALELRINQSLGTVLLDQGMMSLAMGSIPQHRGITLHPAYANEKADTLVYFCPNDWPPSTEVAAKARDSGLSLSTRMHAFRAPICLVTNRKQDELGTTARLLQPVR